jgi:hypothetical protein
VNVLGVSLFTARSKDVQGVSLFTFEYWFKFRTVRHPGSPVPEWIKILMLGAVRHQNKMI